MKGSAQGAEGTTEEDVFGNQFPALLFFSTLLMKDVTANPTGSYYLAINRGKQASAGRLQSSDEMKVGFRFVIPATLPCLPDLD